MKILQYFKQVYDITEFFAMLFIFLLAVTFSPAFRKTAYEEFPNGEEP